jgi:hypothetical protein
MAKHYLYRLDHDTGFAPHVLGGVCTLCGCKVTTVERWAQQGSWVVGIGGNGTGKPDALVYAMRVDATPSVAELRGQFPKVAAYLSGRSVNPSARVLLSRHFYYLGKNAIDLPRGLKHLVIRRQGCKQVTDGDVARLSAHLARMFPPGVHGAPNNMPVVVRAKCGVCSDRAQEREKVGRRN